MNVDWIGLAISWLPMLVILTLFLLAIRFGGFQSKYQALYLEQMKAQIAALQRIADALEKRA